MGLLSINSEPRTVEFDELPKNKLYAFIGVLTARIFRIVLIQRHLKKTDFPEYEVEDERVFSVLRVFWF